MSGARHGDLRGPGSVGQKARRAEVEGPLSLAVMIDEGQAAPVRCQFRGQRVIGHTGTADQRHDSADIDHVLRLDTQQMQPQAFGGFADERNSCQSQETGGIWRPRKAFEKGDFH